MAFLCVLRLVTVLWEQLLQCSPLSDKVFMQARFADAQLRCANR